MGIPVLGCSCAVCTSTDPHNARLRTAGLLRWGATTLLIDAGPDIRTQLLRERVAHIDAVLLTHAHADHIGGIDDLRPFTMRSGTPLPLYGNAGTLERVRHMFDYAFDPAPSLSTRPSLETRTLDGPMTVGAARVEPFEVLHGTHSIVGYRFGSLAYITDASALPPETMRRLTGLHTLVINALRYTPHPLHLTVDEALGIVAELEPRQAYFVHITHDLDHTTANRAQPPHAQLAYDGQVIEVPDA
jgi:phosphoribosyl 1,2-cyclic phosphate phosphodiesterase